MAARRSVSIPLLLKLGASALLLGALAWRLDTRAVADALLALPVATHLAALACVAGSVALSVLRWKRALAYLGEPVRFAPLLGDQLVGRLFNLALPTQVGGDAVRAARCSRRLHARTHAWAAVLFERLVGFWVLGMLGMLGMLALGGLSSGLRHAPPGLAGAIALGIVAATALLFSLDRVLAALVRLAETRTRFARVTEHVAALQHAFAQGLGGWAPRLELAAWSLAAQLLALAPLALAAHAWSLPAALEASLLGTPAVLVLSMLPVTLGGFGLREALFVLVLAPFGIEREPALALAVVWVATQLPAALAGAVWLSVESRRVTADDPEPVES